MTDAAPKNVVDMVFVAESEINRYEAIEKAARALLDNLELDDGDTRLLSLEAALTLPRVPPLQP